MYLLSVLKKTVKHFTLTVLRDGETKCPVSGINSLVDLFPQGRDPSFSIPALNKFDM